AGWDGCSCVGAVLPYGPPDEGAPAHPARSDSSARVTSGFMLVEASPARLKSAVPHRLGVVALTPAERALVSRLRTPAAVQRWLDSLPYNKGNVGKTLRSFRGVLAHKTA